jgi:hypothetical protein
VRPSMHAAASHSHAQPPHTQASAVAMAPALLLIMLPPLTALASSASPSGGTIGPLVLVPQAPRGAACLDGSPPGYWMSSGAAPTNTSRWVIHAQGGGWCWTEEQCAARAKGNLGSSKAWGQSTSCYGECDGILSRNCTLNRALPGQACCCCAAAAASTASTASGVVAARRLSRSRCACGGCVCMGPYGGGAADFCTWNHVWVGYCDGSSFSGQVEGLHQGLHYRGRPNLDAVLDSLIQKGLGAATE